ncbi:hypothetical protein KY284_026367 [Solanum tuberosum]|nr:hypothetical protein KY284_026367 [Solanum tuberosum]
MGASGNPAGAHQSGNERIYYNAGFKSYEIARFKNGAEVWFEWVERSQYQMRRVKISIKVLRWLVAIFIEASKVQGMAVKRWSMKDHFAELYCTLKYNEKGRYISFIATQGISRSIIITPETNNKGGWGNIAHKIAGFTCESARAHGIDRKEKVQ